jgi:hypothetical protein
MAGEMEYMSFPDCHDTVGKMKRIICFLCVLIFGLGILWNAEPRKQTPYESQKYALSGENYRDSLLEDEKWLIDSRLPQKFVQLVKGDSGIDSSTIKLIGNVIQNKSAEAVYTITEMQFNAPVRLYIDSNETTYTKTLKAHFSADKLTNEVNESLGIQYNNLIYIPFYKFTDCDTNGEIGNTLAHELTHVALYQNGIEAKLPIWINEGTAWYVGTQAEKEIDPQAEEDLEQEIQETILYEAKEHKLYTLDLNNTMFTKNEPEYNMEWEDYLAVKELISRYGIEKFQIFISKLQNENTETAFRETFGMPISTFEQSFYEEHTVPAK